MTERYPRDFWRWQWGYEFGKFRSVHDIRELRGFTCQKSIALVGNAFSIFKNKKNIDKHDITCRMNQTFPNKMEERMIRHLDPDIVKNCNEYLGSKSDIVFISQNYEVPACEAQYLIWCTTTFAPVIKNICPNLKNDWILFGQKEWYDLETDLGSRPTTGLIALYFLITYTQFKDLTIYGFDFWKTPDWLCGPTRVEIERNTDVHSFDKDKEYFFKLIKPYPNIMWVED